MLDSRVTAAGGFLVVDEKCLCCDPFTSLVTAFDSMRQYKVRDGCDVVHPDGVILARGAVEGNRLKKVVKDLEDVEYEFRG